MVLPQGGNDSPILRSPRYPVYAGNVMSFRFMNYFELGNDSLTVHVLQDTLLLGTRIITGSQESYTQESLEFTVPSTGDISVDWRCVRTDSTGSDWHYVLDDVELAVIATGNEPDPRPSGLRVTGPWPNPSSGNMSWKLSMPQSGTVLVEIYDLAGRKAFKKRFVSESTGSKIITVDLSMLTPGVYMAQFSMMKERVRTTVVHIH